MRTRTVLIFGAFTCACIFGLIFAPNIYNISTSIIQTQVNIIENFLEQILVFTLQIIGKESKHPYLVKWSDEHKEWIRCQLDIDKDCKIFIQMGDEDSSAKIEISSLLKLVYFLKDVLFMVLIGVAMGYFCSRI